MCGSFPEEVRSHPRPDSGLKALNFLPMIFPIRINPTLQACCVCLCVSAIPFLSHSHPTLLSVCWLFFVLFNSVTSLLDTRIREILDSNCICNWTSSQHYSNGRVTLTFDLWTPKNYTLVPFPKYYHWSKYEGPRCYGSKVRVDRTKVGRNKNKKNNNNNNQHENNTSSIEWEDVITITIVRSWQRLP